jgi:hypothetical protein
MATAIPPRAAEVANKRLVRQKFLGSGGCSGFSTSTGPALNGTNLRKGTGYRNLFLRTASMVVKTLFGSEKYKNWDLKSSEICFLAKFGICN